MDEVDHVIGNGEKTEAATFNGLGCGDTERVKVNDIMSVKETAGHLIDGFGAQARAYVQIQNGCDHRCTFCIIPYGRGPSRSVPAGEVVAQVRKLVANGYAEIVLTGVDITAYGADLPGELTLGRLVTKILKLVPELKRLRLSSIDSVEADGALLKAIAEEERLMPHLHLSLQAGHDLTLKRMKRRHSRAHAVSFCEEVRRLRPDMVFGADLIAGPTETGAMFDNTLRLIDEAGLTWLHVFPTPCAPARRRRVCRLCRAISGASVRRFCARLGRSRPLGSCARRSAARSKRSSSLTAPAVRPISRRSDHCCGCPRARSCWCV
jgi:threonylcarbamoyladenosine tRNA methylthiotransferase MtaB